MTDPGVRYWIRNADGTVLGPVSLRVIRDLAAAGQLPAVREVSTNGQGWALVSSFPELVEALGSAAQRAAQDGDAAAIHAELEAARRSPPHAVFGVPQGAPVESFRTAFFEKVKRYHPHRLPPSATPALRQACAEMFKYLSDLFLTIQKGSVAGPSPAAAPGAAPPPTFQPHEFVGLERKADGLHANVWVGARTAGMFTAHRLVNVSTGGLFLADQTLPLGTPVHVTLRFEGVPRTLSARGTVVLESAGADPRQPRGTGVQLTLTSEERAFLKGFVAAATAKNPPA